jgi:hypothetical protein
VNAPAGATMQPCAPPSSSPPLEQRVASAVEDLVACVRAALAEEERLAAADSVVVRAE